jgi:hypothetical protein
MTLTIADSAVGSYLGKIAFDVVCLDLLIIVHRQKLHEIIFHRKNCTSMSPAIGAPSGGLFFSLYACRNRTLLRC